MFFAMPLEASSQVGNSYQDLLITYDLVRIVYGLWHIIWTKILALTLVWGPSFSKDSCLVWWPGFNPRVLNGRRKQAPASCLLSPGTRIFLPLELKAWTTMISTVDEKRLAKGDKSWLYRSNQLLQHFCHFFESPEKYLKYNYLIVYE